MKWNKVSNTRWELEDGSTVLAIVRKQDDKTFEWITSRAHRHAESLDKAKTLAEKEIEKR